MCVNCDNQDRVTAENMEAAELAATNSLNAVKAKVIRSIPVTDSVTLHILDETHSGRIHTITNVLTQLQSNYPALGKVDVYYPSDISESNTVYNVENAEAQAATMRVRNGRPDYDGPDRVMSISDLAFSTQRSYDGWHMPAHNLVSEGPAVITHEWGHVVDNRPSNDDELMKKFVSAGLMNVYGDVNPYFFFSISEYGQVNEKESYAECFTEWAVTNGETDNFAAKWYAKEYDWPKRTITLPKSRSHRSSPYHDKYNYDHDNYDYERNYR